MPAIPIAQLVPGTRYVIYRPDIPDDVPHPAGQLFIILNTRSMYGLIAKFAGIPPDYITEYHYPGTRREYYAVGDPDIPVAPAAPAAPAAAPAVPAAANYAIPESAGERAAIAARSDALRAEANAAGRAAKKAQTIAAAGGAGGGGPRKNRRRTRRATRNRRLSRRNNRRNDRRN